MWETWARGSASRSSDRLWQLLEPLRTDANLFVDAPPSLGRRASWVVPRLVAQVRYTEMTDENRLRHPAYLGIRDDKTFGAARKAARPRSRGPATKVIRFPPKPAATPAPGRATDTTAVVEQPALERARKNGRITLPDGDTLEVTNLHKVFWPSPKHTKGDLLRYYAWRRRRSCPWWTTGRS
ncbi:MAG: hypothetical protein R2712_31115 [Vicinamibacterales bacterium]